MMQQLVKCNLHSVSSENKNLVIRIGFSTLDKLEKPFSLHILLSKMQTVKQDVVWHGAQYLKLSMNVAWILKEEQQFICPIAC